MTATSEVCDGEAVVRVNFTVPPGHVLYAERLKFETSEGMAITPANIPEPSLITDKATGKEKALYDQSFTVDLKPGSTDITNFVVRFQGCSNSACYFPDKRVFHRARGGIFAEVATPIAEATANHDANGASGDWQAAADKFDVVARETGYLRASDFLSFLNQAALGNVLSSNEPLARFKKAGIVATIFLILIGGAALNLTPCVLPLIPINLAIIGAGARAQSRHHGFWHGAIYGAGMALVYGVLGLVAVLTGSKFGTLNSSVWFNAAIAAVFVVMSLGMFGLINVDFSRLSTGVGKMETVSGGQSGSQSFVAFTLGAVTALLAGACVAPVVISVLLLSASLYGKGVVAGLLLPFLLGVGMALPWPFAGAGLACLPKPGRWMNWVKYGFGVLILLFSFYYGHLAFRLARTSTSTLTGAPAGQGAPLVGADQSLVLAFETARVEGRSVFIDFQASWCKNCEAMEATVFTQADVQQRLKDFVVVKYQAERPNESPAKEVLDRFSVLGLPTYVVLKPTREK